MADAPRRHRLSRSADFERVYRKGHSAQHRLLVLYRFERPDEVRGCSDGCRIGITVSRKLGIAVDRNRLKRQLREALRACNNLTDGYDYVAIARPGLGAAAEKQGFEWLSRLVTELTTRLVARDAPAE